MLAIFVAPALAKDSNHDGPPDSWEKQNNLSLRIKQSKRDPDHDKLSYRDEFKSKTNPHKADTDGDGVPDGQENIGYIGSFNGMTLTLNLIRGGTISGKVTSDTDIECGLHHFPSRLEQIVEPLHRIPSNPRQLRLLAGNRWRPA